MTRISVFVSALPWAALAQCGSNVTIHNLICSCMASYLASPSAMEVVPHVKMGQSPAERMKSEIRAMLVTRTTAAKHGYTALTTPSRLATTQSS